MRPSVAKCGVRELPVDPVRAKREWNLRRSLHILSETEDRNQGLIEGDTRAAP